MNLIKKRYESACEALSEACHNKFQLKASIPARVDHDHDILIADSLEDIPKMLAVVEAARNMRPYLKEQTMISKHFDLREIFLDTLKALEP